MHSSAHQLLLELLKAASRNKMVGVRMRRIRGQWWFSLCRLEIICWWFVVPGYTSSWGVEGTVITIVSPGTGPAICAAAERRVIKLNPVEQCDGAPKKLLLVRDFGWPLFYRVFARLGQTNRGVKIQLTVCELVLAAKVFHLFFFFSRRNLSRIFLGLLICSLLICTIWPELRSTPRKK